MLLLLLLVVVVVARAVMTTIINSVRSSSRPACDAARPPAFDSREARPSHKQVLLSPNTLL